MRLKRLAVGAAIPVLLSASPFFHKHDVLAPPRLKPAPAMAMPVLQSAERRSDSSEWPGYYLALPLVAAGAATQLARNHRLAKQASNASSRSHLEDVSTKAWHTAAAVDASNTTLGLLTNLQSVKWTNLVGLSVRLFGLGQLAWHRTSQPPGHFWKHTQSAAQSLHREGLHFFYDFARHQPGKLLAVSALLAISPTAGLAAIGILPARQQFERSRQQQSTTGLSLISLSAYGLASLGWALNAALANVPVVALSCLISAYYLARTLALKLQNMREKNKSVGHILRKDLQDTYDFACDSISAGLRLGRQALRWVHSKFGKGTQTSAPPAVSIEELSA